MRERVFMDTSIDFTLETITQDIEEGNLIVAMCTVGWPDGCVV